MEAKKAQRIVVLTGAGISAESGINTFRDSGGLWENHRLEDVATPEAFHRDPEFVQRFYNARRAQLNSVTPNPAHIALAEFEAAFEGDFLLVTQNVDHLHGMAGSKNLIHMHGELRKSRCVHTGKVHPQTSDITNTSHCECCQQAQLRPHIVWFGEMPLYMDEIYQVLENCDLFISIGTSGNVYPAAGFVEIANSVGARTVEINLEPSNGAAAFKETIHGLASSEVPAFLSRLNI